MPANPAVPFGLRPAFQYLGGAPNYQLNERAIAYNNSNTIAYNDPVVSLSSGYIDLYTNGTSSIHGVLMDVSYPNATAFGGVTFTNQWAAVSGLSSSTIVHAKVVNDPNMIFLAQAKGAATTIAKVGYNVDIYTGTSGAPNGAGISTCSLDIANAATTALPFRIIGILGLGEYSGAVSPIPNYVATNDNQFLFVKLNTSDLLNTTGI